MESTQSTRRYWRSFEEFTQSPDVDAAVDQEFPDASGQFTDGVSRRRWLQLMGASLAFGSMAGCRMGEEIIAPFAFRPQNRIPGMPERYATSVDMAEVSRPLLAVSFDGRPIKLDGNPDHPEYQGGSDVFLQAMILQLYDPDRSRLPQQASNDRLVDSNWEEASSTAKRLFDESATGKGIAVLAEPQSSPSLRRLREKLAEQKPEARWFQFSSISDDNLRAGTKMAFGRPLRPIPALDQAKIIVAIDDDLIGNHPAGVRNSRQFIEGRDADQQRMNRMYSVESCFTQTGAMADHRLAVRASQIAGFVEALEKEVDRRLDENSNDPVDGGLSWSSKIFHALAQDLVVNQGQSVLTVGWRQPPEVHARVFRINQKLGNIGKTLRFVDLPDEDRAPGVDQIAELAQLIKSGEVSTLFVLGGNPVYDAPVDLDFEAAYRSVPNTIHLGMYADETARASSWHINMAHPLEAWGDGISFEGLWCVAQPLIRPLFDGKSTLELLALLMGEEQQDGLEIVRATAENTLGADGFQERWDRAVHDGFFADSAPQPTAADLQTMELADASGSWTDAWSGSSVEIVFSSSASVSG